MYQGFDVSFADSGLSTDSAERNKSKRSKEKGVGRKKKGRTKRKRERQKRKRKMKKDIRKVVREIKNLLKKSYKNVTTQRKRKTKQLKELIKDLKRNYTKEKQSVKNKQKTELLKIDTALQKKLDQLIAANRDFIRNSTFRDIVMNGTINKEGARMLLQAYPELSSYVNTRRNEGIDKPKDYLEYDIEYGLLYF